MTKAASSICRVLLLAAALALATTGVSAAAGSTTPETKARMLQLIETLETDPFIRNGKAIRGEVTTWLIDAPDIHVALCPSLLGDITKIKSDEGGTLVVQLMFSEAKFILDHPDQASDQGAVNVAGVAGVLRTYASMKAVKPALAIREFDELAKLQASGQLAAEVIKRSESCH